MYGINQLLLDMCDRFASKHYDEDNIEIYFNDDPIENKAIFQLKKDDAFRYYEIYYDDIYSGKIKSSDEILNNLDILAEDLLKELEMRE